MGEDIFAAAMQRIDAGAFGVTDLLASADRLSQSGEIQTVLTLYKTWLERNPEDPLRHLMYFNYSTILSNNGALAEAREALEKALAADPGYFPARINLGSVLERMGGKIEAINEWFQVIGQLAVINGDNLHYLKMTLTQIGRIFETANMHSKAEEIYRRCLELDPDQPEIMRHYLSMMQQQCKWPIARPFGGINPVTRKDCLKNIDPLTLGIYSDDPLYHLTNSYFYNRGAVGQVATSFADRHAERLKKRPERRLRIGYISSDLRQHAVGYLTAELFEEHDRAAVDVFIYHSGPSADDPIGRRIRQAVEHWTDITKMPDETAAKLIFADEIDILVDLNGHTSGQRAKVLAMRPAPIIVNWLGYPGSVASPVHHYIIADEFIIPKEFEKFYSEKVARIPCYQPNDRKRTVGTTCPSREEAGLPADAMVYCAFNGQHKITPHTWKRWMSILSQVENSVLWMLDSTQEICDQIRSNAEQHGVSASRLIFANRISNPDHLARYPLADLFLDTSPYGAHTTASDAMWMGVPIITLAGRSFASRVCGSIMKSAGLADLICTRSEQYVETAVELGRHRDKLLAYRQQLRASRDACVLFDTTLLARSVEEAYRQMWADLQSGKLPQPDLANMEVYRDIALELDNDDVEISMVEDYEAIYRRKLAERANYSYVAKDGRLAP